MLCNTNFIWQFFPNSIVFCTVFPDGAIRSTGTSFNEAGGGVSSMQDEEILRIRDVAVLLKVGAKSIYSMAQSGELPAFKV